MKKIFVHSPYWSTKGGGERYAITVAQCLVSDGEQEVYVDTTSGKLLELGKRFNLDLNDVKSYTGEISVKNRIKFYGVFWLSDGSIPFLPVNKRIIHLQTPFRNVQGRSWRNRLKLIGTRVICNSHYTKKFIDKEYGIDSTVIYPPVEVNQFRPVKKQKLILTVGRFGTGSQHKRMDVLISSFLSMLKQGLKGWRMVVVGIVEDESSKAVAVDLRSMSKGYPVAIKVNLLHNRLIRLYEQAAIYWHAAGFGVDLNKNPERAEHFGISTVEAMAAGAVPIVFAVGGPKEVVRPEKDGLWWQTLPELESQTIRLIQDESLRERLANEGRERSKLFNKRRFCQEIGRLFK